jgi:tRNA threonylcarbamoyladenosine biosynthesis protein TsaE
MTITTHSVEDTYALGRRLGAAAPPGLVIALEGQLGAGKTHLVRGIAPGAKVADPDLVSSPTYVLLNIYLAKPGEPDSKTVYHLDAYRTAGGDEFAALGFEEWLTEPAIVVIEWPSRIATLLPADHLEVHIEAPDEFTRKFRIVEHGLLAAKTRAAIQP